jgi:hypothetical protein
MALFAELFFVHNSWIIAFHERTGMISLFLDRHPIISPAASGSGTGLQLLPIFDGSISDQRSYLVSRHVPDLRLEKLLSHIRLGAYPFSLENNRVVSRGWLHACPLHSTVSLHEGVLAMK